MKIKRDIVTELPTFPERIAPGVYRDAAGRPHIVLGEFLESLGLEDTAENRAVAVQRLAKAFRRIRSDVTLTTFDIVRPH